MPATGRPDLIKRDSSWKPRTSYNRRPSSLKQLFDARFRKSERSEGAGEVVKSLVFGGFDGIVTTFAIVAAAAGAGLSDNTVILMGVANLVADGISMGLGDYLSEAAEVSYARHEYDLEMSEVRKNPEEGIQEMVSIYTKEKGFKEEDAKTVMTTLAKYPSSFCDTMFVDELGMVPPDEADAFIAEARKKGLVTMLSFWAFGSVPVAVYGISKAFSDPKPGVVFAVAAAVAALEMFALGVVKATFTNQPRARSGLLMFVNGGIAGAAAFCVGYGLEMVVHA